MSSALALAGLISAGGVEEVVLCNATAACPARKENEENAERTHK